MTYNVFSGTLNLTQPTIGLNLAWRRYLSEIETNLRSIDVRSMYSTLCERNGSYKLTAQEHVQLRKHCLPAFYCGIKIFLHYRPVALCRRLKCRVVTDHADVLRMLYDKVSTTIDAQNVARNMFQSNALTLKELQSVQSKQNKPIKAAEQLLNTVMNQSGNVYWCFLEALKGTGHQHVFEVIVAGSSKLRGTYDRQCCP